MRAKRMASLRHSAGLLVDGECTQWPTSSSAGLSRRRPVLAHKTHFDCASRTDTIVWAVTPQLEMWPSTRLDNNRSGRCSNSASPRTLACICREAVER